MDKNHQTEIKRTDGQPNQEICSTTLISSSFVNVSSLTFGCAMTTNRYHLTQKVIGCSMLRSTDHFCGTAIRDMNMGGNVLCSNSSFAHCSSASDQNITLGGRFQYSSSMTASTQTFTSCTFRHMMSTTSSTDKVGGAAIALDFTLTYLTITKCAFHNCTVTGNNGNGGALFFQGTGTAFSPHPTLTVSQTSFAECSATHGGGAITVYSVPTIAISASFFWGNSGRIGGVFHHQHISSFSTSNSSFVDNQADYGGVCYSPTPVSYLFTDVVFRDNVKKQGNTGSDLYICQLDSVEMPAANFTRCDSSSATPTIYFSGNSSSDSTLLGRVSLSFGVLSCSVSHSVTTSTVTISTMHAVNGVMSVLLSGGLVARLVFVTFGSTDSTTGTGTTTTTVLQSTHTYYLEAAALAGFTHESSLIDADASLLNPNTTKIDITGMKLVSGSYSMLVMDTTGTQANITLTVSNSTELSTVVSLYPITAAKLQFGTEYTVLSVLRGTTKVFVKDGLSFATPDEPARIIGIWVELDSSGNSTNIVVRGRQIPQGTYTLKLDSSTGPSFEVSFSDALSEERNSSVASVSIFGDQPVLSFNTAYSIFSFTSTVAPLTSILIDANPNSFIVSEPSRITSLVISEWSDSSKTTATLTMTGRALIPNTDYKMHLKGLPKTTSSTATNTEADIRTVTMRTDSSVPSESVSKAIEFYPHASAELLFGYEYEVDSVSLDGSTLLQNSGLSFFTPDEPARLSSIESCSLTASKDGVIVIVKGFALKQDTTRMIVSSSDGREIESDGKIEVKSESECWISFKTSWEENTTHLEFLKTYTLNIGKGGSSELIITPDLSFTVPSGPIVASISAPLTCSSSSFSVGIVGTDLPIESGFIVELVGGLSFLVDFTSTTTGNGKISANLPGQIQFNTDYSVKSVMMGDRNLKCDSVSFRTPLGPTLVDVKADLNASNINNVIVTLESVRMPVGEMTLTVQEGSSTAIPLTVSFVSSEVGSVEVVVFGGSSLKYGTTYKVVSLTSSSLHSSLDGTITFKTPAAPPRIKTASCSLVGEWKRDGEVVLTGEAFPAGTPFSISVDEIDETGVVIPGTNPNELSDTFDGVIGDPALTTHTLSITLFPVPQKMKYSCRYRITSLSISAVPTAVEQTAVFKVPAEPSRLISVAPLLTTSLETVSLSLGGRYFAVEFFIMRLQVTSPTLGSPFEVKCSTVSETELEVSLPISSSDPSSVEFGDVLSVLSLKSESSSAILEISTFSIPHPPRVGTASFSFCSNLNTTFSVTLHGTDLPSNERFLVVLDSDHSFEIVFTNSRSGTSAEMRIGKADYFQYDTEYRIISIRNEETGQVVFVDSSVTFTTGTQPKQIVVFVDSSSTRSSPSCGSENDPCATVNAGWQVGIMKTEGKEVQLAVIGEGTLVARMHVGNAAVRIRGITQSRSRISISTENGSSLVGSSTEKEDDWNDAKGIVNVEKGRVEIDSIIIVLPSQSLLRSANQPLALVWGRGLITITSTRVRQEGQGTVWMGLVDQIGGELCLSDVSAEDMSLGPELVLVRGESGRKELVMVVSEWKTRNVRSTNRPHLFFASVCETSQITLSDSSFFETALEGESSEAEERGVVSIVTAQKTTRLEDCSFTNCLSSISGLDSSILSIATTRTSSACDVAIARCSFTRHSTSTSSPFVHIVVGTNLARIVLNESRFLAGVGLFVIGTASSNGGVLVQYESSLPIVVRQRVEFRGCALEVRRG